MTDIVYILGNGANKIDNLPLRWSLRSLQKYATNVGRVIVCGNIPNWLSDEVIKIPSKVTTKSKKHYNILNGIVEVVTKLNLTNEFLFSSDDHYLCKQVDIDKWPRYYGTSINKGKLYNYDYYLKCYKRLPQKYDLSLIKTRSILEKNNLSIRRAAIHLDTWMDPVDVLSAKEFMDKYQYISRIGPEFTCVISAFYEKRMIEQKIEPKFVPYYWDRKVRSVKDCIRMTTHNLPGFTTSPIGESNPQVVQWMNEFFKEPSKWEKVNKE